MRTGSEPELTTREKHLRECYVVAEEGADKAAIEQAIKTMPNYFDEYDTTVTFISLGSCLACTDYETAMRHFAVVFF